MKIILSALATAFLATVSADGGSLRASTERKLNIEETPVDDPGDMAYSIAGAVVCAYTVGTKDVKGLPTFNRLILEAQQGATNNIDLLLANGDKITADGKAIFKGVKYFEADEQTKYKHVDPVLGSLSRMCKVKRDSDTTGDPHFTTFTGKKFEFMGGCDLLLLDNPTFNDGQGITLHIRTKIHAWYSYIESAAVKIGDDTFEVKSGLEAKDYWVNGQAGEKTLVKGGPLPFTIGGFPVRFRIPKKNVFQFKIFLPNGQELLIRSVKDFLHVEILHATPESFVGSVGLMGDFNAVDMIARDGVTVMDDGDEYGKEYQVLSSEPKLFHNIEGVQHPQTCAMPSKEAADKQRRRRLGEGLVSREAAAKACAKALPEDLDDCMKDVLATGDVGYAVDYDGDGDY